MKRLTDQLDEKILSILREDSRRPFVEIAHLVGLSEAAVRRRVINLTKDGTIAKFTIETNVGNDANAITLLSINPSYPTPEISVKLKRIRGIRSIFEITGEYDIAAILSGSNIAEINKTIDEIRQIPGIDDSNTVVVLRVVH
jgi:DNA-binding Lrp family transcriptional regulator